MSASRQCVLCRVCHGELEPSRLLVCSACLSQAALHSWRRWDGNVAGPDDTPKHLGGPVSVRYLVKANGCLGPDPRYGREKRDRAGSRPVSDAEIALHHSLGEDLRPALARWYAACGLSAEEIADRFLVTSLGRERREISVRTVHRWASHELRQYQAQRRLVLESHPLVRDARRLRVEDPSAAFVARVDLLIEYYQQTRAPWVGIVLEEVERQLRPLRLGRCEHCRDPFLANRADTRFCSPRCRKAASRANVTVNCPVSDTLTLSEEGILMATTQVLPKAEVISQVIGRLDAQDRLLDRIERTLADISWGVFKMTSDSTLAGRVVDALIESARIEEAA
jgi:hypothetical protein